MNGPPQRWQIFNREVSAVRRLAATRWEFSDASGGSPRGGRRRTRSSGHPARRGCGGTLRVPSSRRSAGRSSSDHRPACVFLECFSPFSRGRVFCALSKKTDTSVTRDAQRCQIPRRSERIAVDVMDLEQTVCRVLLKPTPGAPRSAGRSHANRRAGRSRAHAHLRRRVRAGSRFLGRAGRKRRTATTMASSAANSRAASSSAGRTKASPTTSWSDSLRQGVWRSARRESMSGARQ